MDFAFDLSQGLFSSAGVDVGTQLLLKVVSRMFDGNFPAGSRKVLDAGCGVGVIGICVAAAQDGLVVRCQDRDELARLFTLHNAAKNNVSLEAYAEPLLAGPKDEPWDLILSNVPAKAGTPVLEDFVSRSLGLLNPGGRVAIVVVHTLADFFRDRISLAGAELLSEQQGSGHNVFVYAAKEALATQERAVEAGPGFLSRYPFYLRTIAQDKIEGIPLGIEAVHGASGFDGAGNAVQVAAKLVGRIGPAWDGDSPLLVHEPGQGFFPCWLLEFLRGQPAGGLRMVLSGRNILALEAAWHNVALRNDATDISIVPAADLRLGKAALLNATGERRYASVLAFPELLPQSSLPKGTDQLATLWASVPSLLMKGGILLVTFASSDAERFDRKKPAGFIRLGGIKRDGFRALAYRLAESASTGYIEPREQK